MAAGRLEPVGFGAGRLVERRAGAAVAGERIGGARRGVSHAHAVHGGRELRVYVRERDVDDLAVVEMSSDIAHQIGEEMTFPGQIKVTVIRAFEAAATAN